MCVVVPGVGCVQCCVRPGAWSDEEVGMGVVVILCGNGDGPQLVRDNVRDAGTL